MDNLFTKYSNVIELTNNDYEIVNKKIFLKNFQNKIALIIFYAPWCPHCKKSVELFNDIALEFKNKFFICSINCENILNHDICRVAKILKYPTLKILNKNGKLSDYKGFVQKDDIIHFICSSI